MTLFDCAMYLVVFLAVTVKEVNSYMSISAFDYHRRYGIPRATEIKEWEEETARNPHIHRIVGGQFIEIGYLPYQASLIIEFKKNSICGASLISRTRLVTAAHCKNDGNMVATSITVVLGSIYVFRGGLRIPAKDVITHPAWNFRSVADIAVILINPIGFNDIIQPIRLPNENELTWNFEEWTATASGFGLTDDGTITKDQRLSAVNMLIVSNAYCRRFYGDQIEERNICIKGDGGKGICDGDSGGPLAIRIGGRRVLVGVTTHGTTECRNGAPSVFARVSYFVTWILTI